MRKEVCKSNTRERDCRSVKLTIQRHWKLYLLPHPPSPFVSTSLVLEVEQLVERRRSSASSEKKKSFQLSNGHPPQGRKRKRERERDERCLLGFPGSPCFAFSVAPLLSPSLRHPKRRRLRSSTATTPIAARVVAPHQQRQCHLRPCPPPRAYFTTT